MEYSAHVCSAGMLSVALVAATGVPEGTSPLLIAAWTCAFSLLPDAGNIINNRKRSAYSHSLVAAAATVAGFALVLRAIGPGALAPYVSMHGCAFAFLGYALHVVLDSLTTTGVGFLFPAIGRRHQHFPYFGSRLRYPDPYSCAWVVYAGILSYLVLAVAELALLL